MGHVKIDNPASRHAAWSKRRAGLFKKAHELAVLCDAEVAIIIISSDGKVYEFASSSMQKILTRFKTCMELGNRNALQLNPEKPEEEVPKEAGVSEQKADKLKSRKLLGKDLTEMSSHELSVLEEKLNKGLLFIKDTKLQLLKDELEKSRMQEQQVVQKNQMLLRQVEELKNFYRTIYYPMPISVHCPATEHDREPLPCTSFSAQLAITSSPETEGSFQDADKTSLPSTSSAAPIAIDCGTLTQRNPLLQPADKDSLPSTSFGAPVAIENAIKHMSWIQHGVTGSQSGTCLS